MHITVIDAHTLNPGDLSWAWLEKFGRFDIFERTAADINAYAERCQQSDCIIINKSGLVLGEALFSKLPQLKLILVSATGYNIIDVVAARKHGITVCNVPGYGTDSVAQHTWALILELSNRVGAHAQAVANGTWLQVPDWCFTLHPLMELAGKTLGIVGFGNIGQKVAEIGQAFGMRVLYTANSPKKFEKAQHVALDELLAQADIVSLHCPANSQTMGMVNEQFLKKMKNTALLINTSRGQLIHEADLAQALDNQHIAGAALDVLSQEPPDAQNPLLKAKNCLITPHIAWISLEARQRIMQILEQNLQAYVLGQPIHVVN